MSATCRLNKRSVGQECRLMLRRLCLVGRARRIVATRWVTSVDFMYRTFTRGTHQPFTGTIVFSLPQGCGWCMVLGASSGHAGEYDAAGLLGSAHWRLAIRGLRLAGLVLFVAVGGLVTRVWSTGTGLTILAVGVGIYLVGVVVVFTGFIPAIRALPKPRSSFWRLRWLLMRDALHARQWGATLGRDRVGVRPCRRFWELPRVDQRDSPGDHVVRCV
jgi:hypothetical protein